MKRFNTAVTFAVFVVSLTTAFYLIITLQPDPLRQPAGLLAADKGYGVTIDLTQYASDDLDQLLAELRANGFLWLRQPIRWAEVELEPGQLDWRRLDPIFDALARAQTEDYPPFKLIAVLHTAPAWARHSHTPTTSPPRVSANFGRFVRAFALRYGNRSNGPIVHYQIWDEPNLSTNWGRTYVEASAYARLLREAALQIRAVDSQATIILAALAPTLEEGPLNVSDITFLAQLYELKADRWFDVVAGQGYGFDRDASDPASLDVLNFRRIELLRRVMLGHGDPDTPVWLTAFGWNALPTDWSGPKSPWKTGSAPLQAQRTATAIGLARREWPWLGPMLAIGWDAINLDENDPARGFSLLDTPVVLSAFRTAAVESPVATPGWYPPTHPSGHYTPGWRFAKPLADPPDEAGQLRLDFEGTRLDLMVNRGDYRGYLWITVDGQPAKTLPQNNEGQSYLVLYDPQCGLETVTVAQGLAPGRHQVVITTDGGWGHWPIAGWHVHHEIGSAGGANSRRYPWLLMFGVVAVCALSGVGLVFRYLRSWPSLTRPIINKSIRFSLPNTVQLALISSLAIAGYLTPGELGLSLVLLLSLALLLRPEAGIILIAFGLSFLPHQKTLFGDVSLLEVILFSSLLGWLIHWFRVTCHLASAVTDHLSVSGPQSLILPPQPASRPDSQSLTAHRQLPVITPHLPTLALLLVSLLATIFAQDFGVSMFAWRTIVLGAVLFYGLIIGLPETERFNTWLLVDAFVAGATLHAAIALLYYFIGGDFVAVEGVRRAAGPIYPTPNNLALYLDRVWPILLAVSLLPGSSTARRRLYALALVVTGGTLYLTFSRGALLLGLPVGLGALSVFYLAARQSWSWRGALALTGLSAIGLALLLWPVTGTARLLTLFDLGQGSGFFRLKVWQSSLAMLADYPWLGLGLDNFLYQYRTFYILPSAWQEPNLNHPHNFLLEFATQMGLGSVILLLWLLSGFYFTVWPLYRQKLNPLLLGLMSSMAVILGHGLVDQAFFQVDLAFTLFLIIGLVQRASLRLQFSLGQQPIQIRTKMRL